MGKSNIILISLITIVAFISDARAAKDFGTMTLNLSGMIDMNVDPSEVQQIPVIISGVTNMRGAPVYSQEVSDFWNSAIPLVSMSSFTKGCSSSFLSSIPGQSNKYGLKLSHATDPNAFAYMTPALKFSIGITNIGDSDLRQSYGGQFFSVALDLLDKQTSHINICFIPQMNTPRVPSGGAKGINIHAPASFPVYIGANLTPGRLSYKGSPFYINSGGTMVSADYYIRVNVDTDIMVKRSCSVTGVSSQQFNENMTLTDEITRNSTFTLSCGGAGNPVNISATVKEGSYENGQPTKLLLAPINGTVSDKKPWILGMPYRQGQEPSLSCNDAGRLGLIKFDNTEVELSNVNMGNDIAENVGIKWALCKTPQVKAGDYRAKVDISIYVRG